ncbi:MAG: hypothetical protein E7633_07420 [Ruminococcaceae bacterium]|nr:hypothetical protein [Oscillospiraceae bacterium]
MLYIWVILCGNLFIIAASLLINLFFPWIFAGYGLPYIILMPPVSTVAVIAVDGIAAFIIRRLPEKWFSIGSSLSVVSKKECEIYTKLGVRKWREKVPELGIFTGFHKNHVAEPNSNEYLKRFILEANYGVVIHVMCVPIGFLIIFLCPIGHAPLIGIPVALVNAALNLLPAMTLRYNIPKLLALYRRNERHKTSQ